jgi:hypothetical protein
MPEFEYNRNAAVQYAHTWAYRRNPRYYDFEKLGGDCTNFTSQCIYAGAGVMNYAPTFGWYYIDLNNRSPSWSGVTFLYEFMTNNLGPGPHAVQVAMDGVLPGDFLQLGHANGHYFHSPFIVSVGDPATVDNVLVATHTDDRDYYPLSSYEGEYEQIRFIHILGVRS